MQEDAIFSGATVVRRQRLNALRTRLREGAPTRAEIALALLSSVLLIFSFPDFNLWPLAWLGLVPLMVAVARQKRMACVRAFFLGWIAGTVFFYGSCYWLTYAMVRYGGIPSVVAYVLLVPATVVVGLFPATAMAVLARLIARWGTRALFAAPFVWVALEWARLGMTGQLWNAIAYSQAYVPALIQAAHWGSVYAVGFFIVMINAAIAFALLQRNARAILLSAIVISGVAVALYVANFNSLASIAGSDSSNQEIPEAVVVAVQPNVPMEPAASTVATNALIARHISLSERALEGWSRQTRMRDERRPSVATQSATAALAANANAFAFASVPRVVIWPESPMNFTYTRDTEFRDIVARFAAKHHTSVLFNSLEPAPANGAYNAAVLVNEEGRAVAQYDKIRLLPFGEYVPLPRWLPGVNLIPAMVGDFTPGAQYTLMPVGATRVGVFICFESAFPSIAREFSRAGADALINISNDGYLGPTPVMRQHLANAVFRAVENDRPVLRVTNTGITAYINGRGEVFDETQGFRPDVRTWMIRRAAGAKTFYTIHGDLCVAACAAISIALLACSLIKKRPRDMRPTEVG